MRTVSLSCNAPTALAMMGLIEESYRLPLVPMGAANKAKLRDVLEKTGVHDSCRTYRVAV